MNDLVIRGALIVDGSGSEPATGDVAVRDGVITAVWSTWINGLQRWSTRIRSGTRTWNRGHSYTLRCSTDLGCQCQPITPDGGDYRGGRQLWLWIGTLPPRSS